MSSIKKSLGACARSLSSAGVVDFACPSLHFLTFRNDIVNDSFEFGRKLTMSWEPFRIVALLN